MTEKTAWMRAAYKAAKFEARRNQWFTTEDVWERLKTRQVLLPSDVSPRLIGRTMTQLWRNGHARKAESRAPVPHRDARGVGRRNHRIPVWESLICART